MSEWISVNSSQKPLAQDYQSAYATETVLVTDGKTVCECTYAIGGNHIGEPWEAFSEPLIQREAITHWTPLPEPPEGV